MKNAKHYQGKIKKLLRGKRSVSASEVAPGPARVYVMIETILQADAKRRRAAAAMGPLREEYVDLNELRVSPLKDITDCLGRTMPAAREKAEMILTVLNSIFARTNDVSLDWLADRPERELRRTLAELGLGPYASAAAAMLLFGVPAVPVDQTLTDCLKADGYVHPDSEVTQVQSFLEKIVSPRSALGAHEALRRYCEKRAKTLPKKPVVVAAPVVEPPVEPAPQPAERPGTAPKKTAAAKRTRQATKVQTGRARRAGKAKTKPARRR